MTTPTNLRVLARLLAAQAWTYLPPTRNGRPYGPGFFKRIDWVKNLGNRNRRVSLRLSQYGKCLGCRDDMPPGSTGDHLVPLAIGGPDDASNYAPLCRSCNASKGKRDFFWWWHWKVYDVTSLPKQEAADLLCAYARLTYQSLAKTGGLDDQAPDYRVKTLDQAKDLVPRSHWFAIDQIG